jgi:hypothetical protein
MKKLLFALCCCIATIVLWAQPNRVPGPVSVFPIGLTPTASNSVYAMIILFSSSNVTYLTVTNLTIYNDLTVNSNLFVSNNIVINNNLTLSGKATLISNVYVMSIFYRTNTMSTVTIDVNKSTESLSTNNSIAFTGYSNVDGTNVIPFSRIFTNTAGSAAVKSITFPVGTVMLSSPYTNVVYLTNQGVFSGLIWPGFGTNGTWTGN